MSVLEKDKAELGSLLAETLQVAQQFLAGLDQRPVAGKIDPTLAREPLRGDGIGAHAALEQFVARFGHGISGAVGPRYWGFVTGGVTPASLLGDWLATVIDQNSAGFGDSVDQFVEVETIDMVRELLDLPPEFRGAFVSGATMATFTGLGLARQFIGARRGHDISEQGLYGLSPLPVLSATPHATSLKALSLLGMGRSYQSIPTRPDRETMDIDALQKALAGLGQPAIVLASAGTVSTGDFDDLRAIAALKKSFDFWLHVDGAFGAYARATDSHRHLAQGLEAADSITLDAHKWLNVPYDSGIFLTRHGGDLETVFHNRAAYLDRPENALPHFVHETPNGSRRFRALPTWMNFVAYGRNGMKEIFEGNCAQARAFAAGIEKIPELQLLAPIHLNVVIFTLKNASADRVNSYLDAINRRGRVFLSPGALRGIPAIRACFSNWRTTERDVELALTELRELAATG